MSYKFETNSDVASTTKNRLPLATYNNHRVRCRRRHRHRHHLHRTKEQNICKFTYMWSRI